MGVNEVYVRPIKEVEKVRVVTVGYKGGIRDITGVVNGYTSERIEMLTVFILFFSVQRFISRRWMGGKFILCIEWCIIYYYYMIIPYLFFSQRKSNLLTLTGY